MKILKLTILIFILSAGFTSAMQSTMTVVNGIGFSKKPSAVADTSDVNRLALLALSSKIKNQDMKAYIDSAELICEKENIEIPAMLHLARAEYFYRTSDFNNASQEATIALKLSNSTGESVIQARALHFLAR